jgi:hypothetical protein
MAATKTEAIQELTPAELEQLAGLWDRILPGAADLSRGD